MRLDNLQSTQIHHIVECLNKAGNTFKVYEVFDKESNMIGYFIINPTSGYIAQVETTEGDWVEVFHGIGQICQTVRINNVRDDRISLRNFLSKTGFQNTINQIKMEMQL